MEFSMWPQPVGLLKFMLNVCHMSNIQGTELSFHNFLRYIFNIGLHVKRFFQAWYDDRHNHSFWNGWLCKGDNCKEVL